MPSGDRPLRQRCGATLTRESRRQRLSQSSPVAARRSEASRTRPAALPPADSQLARPGAPGGPGPSPSLRQPPLARPVPDQRAAHRGLSPSADLEHLHQSSGSSGTAPSRPAEQLPPAPQPAVRGRPSPMPPPPTQPNQSRDMYSIISDWTGSGQERITNNIKVIPAALARYGGCERYSVIQSVRMGSPPSGAQ